MVRKLGFGPKVFSFRARRVPGLHYFRIENWMAVLDSNQNSEGQSLLSYRVKRTAIRKFGASRQNRTDIFPASTEGSATELKKRGGGPSNRTASPLSRCHGFRDRCQPFSAVPHKIWRRAPDLNGNKIALGCALAKRHVTRFRQPSKLLCATR